MTASTEPVDPIERLKRFRRDVQKEDAAQLAQKESSLYVAACKKLAPLFDYSMQEISEVWAECSAHEEDKAGAFESEMRYRGMGCITVSVSPGKGKKGRPKRDALFELLTDIRKTLAWKQFLQKVREETDGLVILVFKPRNKEKPWVMTNRTMSVELQPLAGRILIPLKGAPDIIIMPLETYLKENLS